jgi:phospholipase C
MLVRSFAVATLTLGALIVATPSRAERPAKCPFAAGAVRAVTHPNLPHGDEIPIDNVVVVMQENRSFDHYFGQLHYEGQKKAKPEPRNAQNPDPTDPGGARITPFHEGRYCEPADLDHSWNGTHTEWDGGAMDGFTLANVDAADPTGARTMGYYDTSDLPFYYALFNTFAMSDHFFASVLSQTFPNRFFLLAATSFGHIRNDLATGATDFSQPTIFNLLDAAGVTWKVYFSEIPFAYEFAYVRNHAPGNVVPIQDYYNDAAAGTLPQVSFVDPLFNLTGAESRNTENDEHPPSNMQVGENYIAQVVNALLQSPQWQRSALFFTYDEHGGFYDHVPPPPACVPDDIPPMLEAGDTPGAFDRYGIRVPFAVISPWARPHYVSHKTYDHTSILRFIETRFDLPALTARDANADPLLRLFKFNRMSFPVPPTLPPAPIDSTHSAAPECQGGGTGGF